MFQVENNNDVMNMFALMTFAELGGSFTQFYQNWPNQLFAFMVLSNGKILD